MARLQLLCTVVTLTKQARSLFKIYGRRTARTSVGVTGYTLKQGRKRRNLPEPTVAEKEGRLSPGAYIGLGAEMDIYRDNFSAIIYYRLSLSLKILLIYRLPISLLPYILLSLINHRDKRFFRHTVFKGSELELWIKYTVFI